MIIAVVTGDHQNSRLRADCNNLSLVLHAHLTLAVILRIERGDLLHVGCNCNEDPWNCHCNPDIKISKRMVIIKKGLLQKSEEHFWPNVWVDFAGVFRWILGAFSLEKTGGKIHPNPRQNSKQNSGASRPKSTLQGLACYCRMCEIGAPQLVTLGPDGSRHSSDQLPKDVKSENSNYCPIFVRDRGVEFLCFYSVWIFVPPTEKLPSLPGTEIPIFCRFFLSFMALSCSGLVWRHLRSRDTSGTPKKYLAWNCNCNPHIMIAKRVVFSLSCEQKSHVIAGYMRSGLIN